MEFIAGKQMADLIKTLEKEGPGFDFFHAVRLLEKKLKSEGVADPLSSDKLSFIPDRSLSFPVSDISYIKEYEKSVQFILSFMGLAGVSSPLPVYFSEYLSGHPQDTDALFDFLTIFNHRIYALFYQSYKKHIMIRHLKFTEDDPVTRILASLAGMDIRDLSPEKLRTLACCTAISSPGRGCAGLCELISGIFSDTPVKIIEFLPRAVTVTNVKRLGAACLGIDSVLGNTFRDYGGKFRVVIGPLRLKEYESFLPGTQRMAYLRKLIESYLAEPLQYDIEVQLQRNDLVPCVLGEMRGRLGESLCLGRMKGEG